MTDETRAARPTIPGLEGRLRLARAAIFWERVWPSCWPLLALLGAFLVLAGLDVLPLLPGWAHLAVLVALAAALVWFGVAVFRGLAAPAREGARRRIEQASGVPHRPLTALEDRLAPGADSASVALWEAHRERMLRAAARLRVGMPRAGFLRRDPFGLRAALLLLLVVAALDAGDQWGPRFARAVHPSFTTASAAAPPTLDVWMTPPEYTGLAPQFLQRDRAGETTSVPTGSTLLAQVTGGRATPKLKLDGAATDFGKIDEKNYKAAATITQGSRLAVEQDGAVLGAWPMTVIPDEKPTVAFATQPQRTQRAALRLEYQAKDDYGVETVKAVIRRTDPKAPDESIELDLPLPGQRLKEAKAASYHDLTPHPWAGLPVEIRLVASDAIGQLGSTEPFAMTLPERVFNHPIARAIIEQRKALTLDPTQREAVGEILSDLSARPGLFNNDTVVFLALRTAQARLILDPGQVATSAVEQLLWETALRVEDGNLSLAQRDLRNLQQQLQDALARNAPDAEIERLMNELQQAMDKYLQSMAENMQKMDPSQLEKMPPIDPSRMISRDDLKKMLDRARELARTGSKDAARDMLARLQEMLENLRAGRPMQAQGDNPQRQAMRAMRDMMQRQQQLLDKSFRASRPQQGQRGQQGQQGQQGQRGQRGQQGQDGQPGEGEMGSMAEQQEGLRRMLGEMMRQMGEGQGDIPQPFGRAERAMRDAAEALRNAQPGQAVGPQTEALDQLQQAARAMADQMQQQMGGENGEGEPWGQPDENGPRQRVDRDPLGRPLSGNGSYDQGDVKIPDQADVAKAREILDELRRRAGERFRPEIERDYIDRLLRRF
jgi:uncharacterized protein (TIGR02302 family)